jgi:hypothetical protein
MDAGTMISKSFPILGLAAFLFSATPVRADVMYRCVDADGRKVFSNLQSTAKGMKCTAVRITDPDPLKNRSASRTPTPPNFPKVDGDAQKMRDAERRRILENEKDAEQRSLEQAKKELAEQEAMRSGNEKNYQRVLDRLQPYKDKVASHERNLEAIEKEISNLR